MIVAVAAVLVLAKLVTVPVMTFLIAVFPENKSLQSRGSIDP